MKKINQEEFCNHMLYEHTFAIDFEKSEKYRAEVQEWMHENLTGPCCMVRTTYWHGITNSIYYFYVITISEKHEAVLFKTTWM